MIRRFWPLLVIAFIVGSLFRLYADSGIGFYRMFGTLGIVVLGAMASRIVVTAQLQEGEREIKEAVADLPDECDVWRLTRKGADRVVVGPTGAVVLLTTSVAQYARGWGLKRNIEVLRRRMEQGVEVVQRQLMGEDELPSPLPIHRAVVFLRRRPRPEERNWLGRFGIETLSPDDVFEFLRQRTTDLAGDDGVFAEASRPDEPPLQPPEDGAGRGEIAPSG